MPGRAKPRCGHHIYFYIPNPASSTGTSSYMRSCKLKPGHDGQDHKDWSSQGQLCWTDEGTVTTKTEISVWQVGDTYELDATVDQ